MYKATRIRFQKTTIARKLWAKQREEGDPLSNPIKALSTLQAKSRSSAVYTTEIP